MLAQASNARLLQDTPVSVVLLSRAPVFLRLECVPAQQ